MMTRKKTILCIAGVFLAVSLNLFFAVPGEAMDTVVLKDGTVVQGDVTIGTYDVIIRTPDGRIITRDPREVVSITPAGADTAAYRRVPDLSFRVRYVSPAEEPWDQGVGGEIRYRYWYDEHIGVSFMGSLSNWDIDPEGGEYRYDDYGVAARIEGDATFFGLGSTLLVRPFRSDRLHITFAAGLEYYFVNSDINAELAVADAYGGWFYLNEDLDIDDGLVALLDVEFAYDITPNLSFIYEGGYQFDVTKGDVTFAGTKIGENKMEGAYMSFGLGFRF